MEVSISHAGARTEMFTKRITREQFRFGGVNINKPFLPPVNKKLWVISFKSLANLNLSDHSDLLIRQDYVVVLSIDIRAEI